MRIVGPGHASLYSDGLPVALPTPERGVRTTGQGQRKTFIVHTSFLEVVRLLGVSPSIWSTSAVVSSSWIAASESDRGVDAPEEVDDRSESGVRSGWSLKTHAWLCQTGGPCRTSRNELALTGP